MRIPVILVSILSAMVALSVSALGQVPVKPDPRTVEAEKIIEKAVSALGGSAYLNAANLVGEGKLSVLNQGRIGSYMSFVDVIVFPDRERTDFDERGSKTVQVNIGDTGWIYEEHLEKFGPQTEKQIEGFKRAIRSGVDHLLRGHWKGKAELSYVGRRPSTLGKRNDVVRLDFDDGFWVEYEFDDGGIPMKTVFSSMSDEGLEITDELRFGRYLKTGGISYPSVVDRYTNGVHVYRATYESMEYNKRLPDDIFTKPDDPKKLRKKLKL